MGYCPPAYVVFAGWRRPSGAVAATCLERREQDLHVFAEACGPLHWELGTFARRARLFGGTTYKHEHWRRWGQCKHSGRRRASDSRNQAPQDGWEPPAGIATRHRHGLDCTFHWSIPVVSSSRAAGTICEEDTCEVCRLTRGTLAGKAHTTCCNPHTCG